MSNFIGLVSMMVMKRGRRNRTEQVEILPRHLWIQSENLTRYMPKFKIVFDYIEQNAHYLLHKQCHASFVIKSAGEILCMYVCCVPVCHPSVLVCNSQKQILICNIPDNFRCNIRSQYN